MQREEALFKLLGRAVVVLIIVVVMAMTLLFGQRDLDRAHQAVEQGEYPQALRLIDDLVEQGDPGAMVLLGDLYRRGQGVDQDLETARNLYLQGAQRRNRDAFGRLVSMTLDVGGGDPDFIEARKWVFLLREQVKDTWVIDGDSVFKITVQLEERLTAQEIETARTRADAWLTANGRVPRD